MEELKMIIKQALEEVKPTIREEQKLTLTIDEAAKLSGIGKHKISEFVYQQDFPCVKIGNKTLINRKLFIDWLDRASEERRAL
ncbi:helix-turn-helix domain-containing protein [Clostridium sp. YIM B02505]|uniref:Helix-turn-helix domain-containing protein n=1 Tax=Clostridium yunnanense TaxID=2800325 RepID=A0ABS1EQC2_9CLOT|nr:helix-turn-helix domain-containing protein [Clostridium yunnanense]MBK1811562.1 helix-turn-helix domain-containing protein [Clostridium yunnanense]